MSNETNTTDDYDYDINESFSQFDWSELAPILVIYSLTFFLGLIGERTTRIFPFWKSIHFV